MAAHGADGTQPTRELPDDLAAAALASLGLGGATLRRVVRSGPPSETWARLRAGDASRLPLLPGPPEQRVERRRGLLAAASRVDVERLRHILDRLAIRVLALGGRGYPASLAADPAPPAVLFIRGTLPSDQPAVAVVGTRNASASGRDLAFELGRDLARAGVVVVSGLARGIDGAAHRGALSAELGGPPVGVVACGLDRVYPPEHEQLWRDVAGAGALVAEVPPGTSPAPALFPARNRILAGLADVVVVVESRGRGGSLITADEAAMRGITVMAVPGSPRSPVSEGTNRLIRDGCSPVLDVGDVLVALGFERPTQSSGRRERRARPDPDDQVLLDLFGADPLTLDTVVLRSTRSLSDVALALGRLEAGGWICRAGAWFERVPSVVGT